MKKMPIELLTTRTASAQNGCPIMWDGNNIILATAAELNLLSIVRTLSSVSRLTADLSTRVETNYLTLSRLTPVVDNLNTFIPAIAQRMNAIEQIMTSETGVSVRLSQIEERTNSVEQNINNIIQGGSTSSGGSQIAASWSAILASLESGNFISGVDGISVEKTAGTPSNPGTYKIKLAKPNTTVSITSTADLIKVLPKADGSITLSLDPSKFANYITAGAGLSLDTRNPERLTIKPASTLITGDNTTTKVTYNELSGQFKVEVLGGAGAGAGTGGALPNPSTQTAIDGITIKRKAAGELYVDSKYYQSQGGTFEYESNNYGSPTTAITSNMLMKVSDTEFVARLSDVGISSLAQARNYAHFSKDLQTFVFNSANAPTLAGNTYLLKDYNTNLVNPLFISPQGITIEHADVKSLCTLDIEVLLRIQNRTAAIEYPLMAKNLIYPFCIYALREVSTGKKYPAGDVFRYASPDGDGLGCELRMANKMIFKETMLSNLTMSSTKLPSGYYFLTAFIGIRVATIAESLFSSAFLNRFAIAQKIKSALTAF